jgi:hypothetical protein
MSSRFAVSRLALASMVCCALLQAQVGSAQETLTNQDVLKMAAAGLGDELIVGKIQEAPQVAFQLSVDDLVALHTAGLSERVVHAMLERSKRAAGPRTRAPQGSAVSLATGEGTSPLHLMVGEVSGAGFGPFVNIFMNYAGLSAAVRTHDKRPALLVSCSVAPEAGHFFLAKLDPDKRHGVRSLKIGKAVRRVGPGGRLAPDEDWVLPIDIKQESEETWSIRAQRDLQPGEYGLYVNLETTPMGAPAIEGLNTSQQLYRCFRGGGIFDFGVD